MGCENVDHVEPSLQVGRARRETMINGFSKRR